jgi:drug/metabolite transporter (DMT)-like permease
VLSAVGFSAMGVCVKLASARLPTGEIVLARAAITLVLSYAMLRHAGVSPFGHQRGKLAFRGVVGFCGLNGFYAALALLPLADATVFENTVPLLAAVLAWWILRERIGWPTGIALVLGIVGVIVIARPSGIGLDPLGIAAALGGATCFAVAQVTIRQLSRSEHWLVIVFYLPLVSVPLAIPWAALSWVTPTPTEWLLLLAIGIATQLGQVLMTAGLAQERAGKASSIGYLQVVFAVIWQIAVFDTVPPWPTFVGAAIILTGTAVVTMSPEDQPGVMR